MGVLRMRGEKPLDLDSLRDYAMYYLDNYGILDATGRNHEGPHALNLLYIKWIERKKIIDDLRMADIRNKNKL